MSARSPRRSRGALRGAIALTLAALAALLLPSLAAAVPQPVWKLSVSSQPTNLISGSSGEGRYLVVATNAGSKASEGEITITDTLPAGLTALSPGATSKDPTTAPFSCAVAAQTVTCKSPGPVRPGYPVWAEIPLGVTAPVGSLLSNEAEISGGGALSAKATTQTLISVEKPPFDFLPGEEGFRAPLIEEDGAPATKAGSNDAYEAITEFNFPTVAPGGFLTGAGHLRDLTIELPPGYLANPAATATRCTEAQLTSQTNPGCPESSQVGTVTITTVVLGPVPEPTPLYNMVPPPGAPASLGFNALGVGIFPHVVASIRSESDYGATGRSNDILARGLNPVLNVSAELWGNPPDKAHDSARGLCFESANSCKGEAQPDAFLSLPVDCPEEPLFYRALADSWEEPAPEFEEREAQYESADLEGNPVEIEGCDELQYEPSITARPTTRLSESPTGLDVVLHQPQDFRLGARAKAQLRDAAVSFPAGLEVNASQANGLGACSAEQIGTLTAVGVSPASFSAQPSSCPDSSKIGKVEVTSPLLGQYDAKNKVQRNPSTGDVIPEPLHGWVYIAKPFDNPFNSLLAVYLTVEDPHTGIFAKLAGKVEPNPVTGQLTTRFEENPELPLEDAKIHLFEGPKAPLQTPPTCGPHKTTTELVPWSAPDTPAVHPTDGFAATNSPLGGPCPATAGQAPNAPSFVAGTGNPQAGAYSPLTLKLSRADGTQRMAKLETTFAPGLSGKLAGIGQCSEAQIAAAGARSKTNDGALELASPSCPAGSEVGILNVGAGAGPSPFHIQGHLYLAGPYKGAPLSFVAITPAVAGPFDLGSVVVRIAAYIDPSTAQVRAVSDPFPQILQGIPVDVRSVAVSTPRPGFTLNPTSCEPKSFGGSVTSTLGQVAPLSAAFQVGGCASLKYKPKLTARLFGPIHRGGHPRFRSVFTARAGDANTARVSFALPPSEFIDQAHFRTICTRVQFAASQCPAGSVYGHVKAFSPLVDYPLEGPIYLRSSSHQLPDAVAVLKGPPSQPIEVDLVGRVDSVNGGIRTMIGTVPDAPVSKAIITLQGAKKGLFQNSTNICKGVHRATAKLRAQNGKLITLHPKVQADCPPSSKKPGGHHK